MIEYDFLLSMGSKRGKSYERAVAQSEALVEHLIKYLFIGDLNNEHWWLRTIVNCRGNISRILKGDESLFEELVNTASQLCDTFDIKQFINSEYNPVFFEKQPLK